MTDRKYRYEHGWRTLSEISRMTGINLGTLRNRLFRAGMSLEDAIAVPVGSRRGPTARAGQHTRQHQ